MLTPSLDLDTVWLDGHRGYATLLKADMKTNTQAYSKTEQAIVDRLSFDRAHDSGRRLMRTVCEATSCTEDAFHDALRALRLADDVEYDPGRGWLLSRACAARLGKLPEGA
jgi:hypothetical protein